MIALDTNILVYAIGDDDKRDLAGDIISRCATIDCIIPLQVLAEFANVCRRKRVLNAERTAGRIAQIAGVFTTIETSLHHVGVATGLADRYQLSYFDALICAIARDAGATTLLSEDMHDGLRIGPLEILNPLRLENADRLERVLPR